MAETVYSQIFAKNKIHESERKQKIDLYAKQQEEKHLQEEKEDSNFWEKLGLTLADVFTEVGGGLLKGIEGLVDSVVSVAGGIGGALGVDTKWAEEIVKFNATDEWYYKGFENNLTQISFLNDAPIVKDILGGVGQMLPTIALAPVGLGGVGIAGIVASAGGSGVEEALNDGANFGQAMLYGTTQAGIEGLIEGVTAGLGKGITAIGKSAGKLAGKVTENTVTKAVVKATGKTAAKTLVKATGKKAAKTVAKATGKTVAKTIGKTMLEEGVSESIEEGLTALLNPITKTTYKGGDALNVYKDMTFYLDAAQQALVGGIVGSISAGGSGAIAQKRVGGKANYNIEQSVQEISTLETKENNLWKNNKLDSNRIKEIETQRQAELTNISERLQSLNDSDRKKTIEKYNLSSMFNEDGTIFADAEQELGQDAFSDEFKSEQVSTGRKPFKSDNIEAYSPNVRNIVLNHAPTSHALSVSAISAKNFITTLNPNAKLVVADDLGDSNAYYDTKSQIFYLSNQATTKQIADTIAGHEFTHSIEGTKEYKNLADYILKNTEDVELKIQQKIEQYKDVNKSVKQGESGQEVALYEAQTEVVAEQMGKLLSDPIAIERIVNQNKSLAHKIVQWLKDVIAKLTKKGTNKEYYNFIRNAEKLYAEAVKKSVGGISLSDVAALAELERLAKLENEEKKVANKEENNYNTVKDGELYEGFADARYSRKDTGDQQIKDRGNESVYSSGRRNVSVFFNDGRIGRLHEVFRNEKSAEKIEKVFDKIYETPKTQNQENLVWHAGNENIKIYFGQTNQRNVNKIYFFDGLNLIIEENATEKDLVDILNIEKPIKRNLDLNKIAHISEDRWNNFLEWQPNAYLTRISIQQFLDMTTDGYVTQRQINARSAQISKDVKIGEIKNSSREHIYLEIDFDTNKVINHEGRHRLTALLNAGNVFVDIFVVPTTKQTFETKNNIQIEGQFNDAKFNLGLVRANSEKFANAILNTFLRDDGNIRYSLKDNFGESLSEEQQEFFKDSKARDEDGNLVAVFHGTEGEFYTFDKALRGYNTGAQDAKLGFFFTSREDVAQEYAVYTQEGKMLNLMNLIAKGDPDVLKLLKTVDGHKQLDQTELIKEFVRISDKMENYSNDVIKVYLNLKNPRVVDWKGKVYKKNAMLKLITEAIMANHDGVIIKNIEDSVDQDLGISDVYVAFEPNQIKLTTNKNPTLNADMRYSLKSDYTESEYNNFGWVRANDVLNAGQYNNFTEKFAKAVASGVKFNKTRDGYHMIPVSDIYNKELEGIENSIVFAKGTIESPKILKILKINLSNETELSIVREDIYENESRGIQTKNTKIFRCYSSKDVSFSVWSEKRRRNSVISPNSNGSKDGGRNNGKIRSIHFNEDGSQEIIYQDKRYALKEDYNYSKGQIAKYVAEHSKLKAYSKTDAEQIINTVISNKLAFGDKYGEISGKTKQQVIRTLWTALNTKDEGYRAKVALDIADYIINNAVVEEMYNDANNEANLHIVGLLKNYLHNVDLNGIKGEIKHHYDNDNSPYLLWGKRKGTVGLSPDEIGQEIVNKGIQIQAANEADIFFEMDAMYRRAIKNLKKATIEKLTSIVYRSEIDNLRQSIASEILADYDEYGHQTKFAETVEKYTNKISALKSAIKDLKAHNKAKNNVISTIERLKDEFVKSKPAGWKVPQQVADFVKKIARVETWRNNISKTAREHLLELNNHIDLVMDETQQQIYPFRESLRELGSGKGELTTQELQTLDTILRQFAWQLRNYNKVNFEDKVQDIDIIAAQGVHESKQAKTILRSGSNILIKFKNKVYTNPYDRLAEIGLYRENSIAMRLYRDMLQGDRNRAKLLYEANQSFKDFFDKNKDYLKDLQTTITIGNVSLTKRQALTLYCTSLRKQGRSHLFNQGYNSGVVRILDNKYSTQGKTLEAFAKGKDITITSEMIAQIKDSLTEEDIAYLELVDNFFNKISKQAKKETDQKLYGITNIEEGYYFPIKVSSDKIYTEAGQNNLNVNQYILDLGMNKSTKPHASNKIVIDGIDNIISNHLQSLSLYYGYAVPLTAYNRIMNRQIMEFEGADSTSNMRGEIQKIDVDFEGYMNKLWQDVQGIRRSDKGFVSSLLSKIRWAGASSALGANPKVLVTQTLSLAAGISEFNPKYVAKGMGHFFGEKQKLELTKYSSLMWERMQIGNSVDIAEIRQIGKEIGAAGKITTKATKFINDFTTKPISWMDSNVIQSLWFAAQYEVADTKGKGFEFGTEANKVEAGKRLDEVVFRTQQTSDPLGRSEWMRSENEFVKFIRMFTGDALQLTGRLISSVNKYNIAKKMIKSGDTAIAEQGKKMLNSAKKGVAKASSAFILNQTILLAIAMAFKWLKGKDDDDEWGEIAKNEAIANIMGLIPFGGDIYDKLLGYEPTNMAYTALSNTVEIGQEFYEGISSLISGDYQEPVKRNVAIRKTVLSISRLLGVPAQNLESYIKGVVGHISPGTREEYEALFKTKSNVQYLKKIKQATEDGNEELADTIINIMFDSRTGKIKDDKVLFEKRALLELGYDVIPKSVGNSITYDGVEYKLTNRQHSQFVKIYSQANEVIKAMVNTSSYDRLEEAAKAKSVNFVYNYYYNLAIEDLLGEDLESKTILFAEAIPIGQLAMAIAQAQLYTAEADKNGKSISGTKKAKVQNFIQNLRLSATQKYMIMGYLGYTNKYGELLVKNYINRLKLTDSQKGLLFEMSGYSS